MELTTKQVAYLRGLGQSLRPILHVGYEGYTPSIRNAVDDLFRGRELMKIRVLNTASEDTKSIAREMASQTNAVLVGVIGKTFVLYRPNPELKERIELPDPGPAKPEPPRKRGR